jgi:hypothetical protein
MDVMTNVELHQIEELLRSEHAAAAKFRMYAEVSSDQGVKKLCEQLADRHREHFIALMRQMPQSDSRVQ